MRKSIQNTAYWDTRLSWASTAFFIGSCANASLKTILPIPDSLWGVLSALVGIGIISVYIMCFKEMYRRSSKCLRMTILLFLTIYIYSSLLCFFRGEPIDQLVMGNAFLTFVWWIPVGIYACSVFDKGILYSIWVKASYIISLFTILMFFFHIPEENSSGATEYNMSFGFYIILPLLIQTTEYINKKNIWLLLLIFIETMMVLIYANRGVLLSLIFFAVYKFALESDSRIKKILACLFLVICVVALLSSIQSVAEAAIGILDVFGFQSRTLEMLAGGVIDDTSGRDELWAICFKMIEMHPLTGWGLGGEHYFLGHQYTGSTSEEIIASSYNPHNGIIQNFVCFGIIGGLVANCIVLYPLLHLKQPKDRYTHDLSLIFASASVIPICISSAGFFITPAVAIYLYLFYRRMPSPVSVKSI